MCLDAKGMKTTVHSFHDLLLSVPACLLLLCKTEVKSRENELFFGGGGELLHRKGLQSSVVQEHLAVT